MEEYQLRAVIERDELAARVAKLRAFLSGPKEFALHDDEQTRLWLQLGMMLGYERILNERINTWALPATHDASLADTGTHVAARNGKPEHFIRFAG